MHATYTIRWSLSRLGLRASLGPAKNTDGTMEPDTKSAFAENNFKTLQSFLSILSVNLLKTCLRLEAINQL